MTTEDPRKCHAQSKGLLGAGFGRNCACLKSARKRILRVAVERRVVDAESLVKHQFARHRKNGLRELNACANMLLKGQIQIFRRRDLLMMRASSANFFDSNQKVEGLSGVRSSGSWEVQGKERICAVIIRYLLCEKRSRVNKRQRDFLQARWGRSRLTPSQSRVF
jgi:hypothetical protein